MQVAGKAALITGGASGIGLGIGRAFAAAGMKVALADIDGEAAGRAAAELAASGATVIGLELDVADRSGWYDAADAVESAFGAVHVLCNNAGIMANGWTIVDLPFAVWDKQVAVNLTGVFNGSHIVVPRILDRGEGGHVVNTASMSGLSARPQHAGYVATKHAVVGFSDAQRRELAPLGVGVSVVCPAAVATRLLETSRDQRAGLVEGTDAAGPATMPVGAQDPSRTGRMVLDAIERNEFFVITHPEERPRTFERFDQLTEAFERAEERT